MPHHKIWYGPNLAEVGSMFQHQRRDVEVSEGSHVGRPIFRDLKGFHQVNSYTNSQTATLFLLYPVLLCCNSGILDIKLHDYFITELVTGCFTSPPLLAWGRVRWWKHGKGPSCPRRPSHGLLWHGPTWPTNNQTTTQKSARGRNSCGKKDILCWPGRLKTNTRIQSVFLFVEVQCPTKSDWMIQELEDSISELVSDTFLFGLSNFHPYFPLFLFVVSALGRPKNSTKNPTERSEKSWWSSHRLRELHRENGGTHGPWDGTLNKSTQ